jgi:hypothetical protein
MLLTISLQCFGKGTSGPLTPVPGYGWTEEVKKIGGLIPTFVYTKDEGFKIIIVMENPMIIDFKNESSLKSYYNGIKGKLKVDEEYGEGPEKLNGKDSYYFDLSFDAGDCIKYLTTTLINVGEKQYVIQRISPIVDTKLDEEMLTIIKTWK